MAEPAVIRIKELTKFSMFTPIPGTGQGTNFKRSRLAWSIRGGNPRITVYTNIDSDANKFHGIINAAMNPETFFIFLELLKKVAAGENDSDVSIDCDTGVWEDGKSTGERVLNSKVHIGKNSTGVVWLKVAAKDRPSIIFSFSLSDFHRIYKSDGSQLSVSEGSKFQAIAVATALQGVYTNLVTEVKEYGQGQPQPAVEKPYTAKSTVINIEEDMPF